MMNLKNWVAAGLVMTASSFASALSFEIPAANTIVLATKMTTPAKLIIADGTGGASCADGFVLGGLSDDFVKTALSIILTARTAGASIYVDYDEVSCDVINVVLTQVVSPS